MNSGWGGEKRGNIKGCLDFEIELMVEYQEYVYF